MPRDSHTVAERRIVSRSDMGEIEGIIIKQLGGEGHRCAFLRSRAYIQLRSAALYPSLYPQAKAAFYDRLSVVLVPDEAGPLVSVHWLDKVECYQDECGAEDPPDPCQKRPRRGDDPEWTQPEGQ